MSTVLIGHTGFVGSQLARDDKFDLLINRSNLETLMGGSFDRIVCAGLPAAKWIANQSPTEDLDNVLRLENTLRTVRTRRFVLLSTIDVYPHTTGADEDFDCASQPNHAYGSHRLRFERFVREQFEQVHIVRLPALFGLGLKKNVLYDLLHDNQLDRINPRSRFQWYPLARLSTDLRVIEECGLPLVNLFPQPIETAAILRNMFPHKQVGEPSDAGTLYDLQTRFGRLFGGEERYVMSGDATLVAMRSYVDRELSLQ